MPRNQERSGDTGNVLVNDPRVGKRVFCRMYLPREEIYGTIRRITRYPNGIESWEVRDDVGFAYHGPPVYFTLYEDGPELHVGSRVRYGLKSSTGTVVQLLWTVEQFFFLIAFDDGQQFTALPQQLTKL